MKLFSNLKIGAKLGLGFGLVLTLAVALGIQSLTQVSKLNDDALDIGMGWMKRITVLSKLRFDVSKLRQWEMNYFALPDRRDAERNMDEALTEIGQEEKLYEPTIVDERERQLYQGFRAAWEKHLDLKDRVLTLAREGKEKDAEGISMSEGLATFAAADKFLADDVQFNVENGDRAVQAAEKNYSSGRYWIIALQICAIIVGLIVAVSVSRSFSSAAGRMLDMIEQVAANNLSMQDMEIRAHDEIGQAATALNKMKNNLHQVIQLIAGTAAHVASASEELSTTSQQISANSQETSAQAQVVSTATQQVSQNLQTVATGAEEMSASIKEIASNATEAAKIATSAVKVAETANATVSKLGDSSMEIGQVIKVITSIAQQTNLLALNATIEAARAGEAGKGFAVVANEVKELAKETAKATEDISRKIEAIQVDTKAAVGAIASIGEVINQVNGISNTIATAVEEQNATTNEMARNVTEAARGSGEITNNIGVVALAAESTSRGAVDTQKAAQQLVETSIELRRLVDQFRINNGAGLTATVGAPTLARSAHAGS